MRAAGALFTVVVAAPLAAQISTPQELRNACEQNVDHIVTLFSPTKLHVPGAIAPTLTSVSTGCTIVIGPGAKLDAEYAGLNFAGPLTIQSAGQTEIKLVKSRIVATAINVLIAGPVSSMAVNETDIIATEGGLAISFAAESKMEVVNRYSTGLSAATTVSISGGPKFSGLLDELPITAPLGVSITMAGADANLKIVQVPVRSAAGAIAISASGEKANIEIMESTWRMRDGVAVTLLGSESAINLKQTVFGSMVNGTPTSGDVRLEAGADANNGGKIELVALGIRDVGAIDISASRGGSNGSIAFDSGDIGGNGDLRIETGAQGKTLVNNVELASPTLVRVATGPGGSCIAQPRFISNNPLVVELCVP